MPSRHWSIEMVLMSLDSGRVIDERLHSALSLPTRWRHLRECWKLNIRPNLAFFTSKGDTVNFCR